MLSLFPEVFFLSPYSATLLRITAGIVFAYLALRHYHTRHAVAEAIRPLAGSAAGFASWTYIVVEVLLAILLIIGLWTQAAALIGMIASVKSIIFKRSFRVVAPLSRLTYALLAVICISVFVTGAGLIAFDWAL